jgi:hypothetical protein
MSTVGLKMQKSVPDVVNSSVIVRFVRSYATAANIDRGATLFYILANHL